MRELQIAGRCRFATLEDRRRNKDLLEEVIERHIASRPSALWLQRLREAGLTQGEVRDIASVVEHRSYGTGQMLARAFPWVRLPLIRFPLGRPGRVRHLPVLGYGPQHQADLARRGIIAMEPPQS